MTTENSPFSEEISYAALVKFARKTEYRGTFIVARKTVKMESLPNQGAENVPFIEAILSIVVLVRGVGETR